MLFVINISIREIYEYCSHRDVSKRKIEFIQTCPTCHHVVVVIVFSYCLCTFNFREKAGKGGETIPMFSLRGVPERGEFNVSTNPIRSKKLVTRQRAFRFRIRQRARCAISEKALFAAIVDTRASYTDAPIQMEFSFLLQTVRILRCVQLPVEQTIICLRPYISWCVSRARPRDICISA